MQTYLTSDGMIANEFVRQSHTLGHLLYWHKHGKISVQVRQDRNLRWLLINDTLQSVIEIDHPEHLLFPHLHILAKHWQQQKTPKAILELGLGAGAIRDYLHAHYPDCAVTSIDNNPDIIHCYKRYFGGDPLSALECADVFDVLERKQHFDWIILDLFSDLDAPVFLFKHKFYHLLRAALNRGGVLYINFLAEHDSQLKQLTHLLITNFGKKPSITAIDGYANHIIEITK
ncbi:Spermidine synthase-like protein [Pseudoalteromonas luteoviolacea B = ATCC 29581]|nr:Spermidine synthase-like protein [Pseudoalteromonas luteoviolacea B = ATCC 29581]